MNGKLSLVSVGPGYLDLVAPMAQLALRSADTIVGYEFYMTWISSLIQDKEIYTAPLTQERERALTALKFAREGRHVALVSSGDIGIYAMAALAFEEMLETDQFDVEVIPGITAANACASLLGSPLSHDFATLSLSDLLCPWEWIEHRAERIASADLAVALYNVQSKKRQSGVYRIIEIMLQHKHGDTACGVVRNAYRPDQFSQITSLSALKDMKFDMFTSIVIGNKFTKSKRNWIYTPRGYNHWSALNEPSKVQGDSAGNGQSRFAGLPDRSVWVFTGTGDGNKLAQAISHAGYPVVISTATEYGGMAAAAICPDVKIISGCIGYEKRKQLVTNTAPIAVVDATHPHSQVISQQLIQLTEETGVPYIRFERPQPELPNNVEMFDSLGELVPRAIAVGKRIFLATGSKQLGEVLNFPNADSVQWFVRIAPDNEFLEKALRLGIPRTNICAMQGPFSHAFNETLWREWAIDCVVTKESGESGGFLEKVAAAADLQIPIFALRRPSVDYPQMTSSIESAMELIKCLGESK